jgi:hypothetical protein
MAIVDNMLSDVTLSECLLAMDEKCGKHGPLNSVCKIDAVWRKCGGSAQDALWCIEGVIHSVVTNQATSGEMSMPFLTGRGRGGFGLLDTLRFKKEIHALVLDKIDGLHSGVRSHLEGHSAFRASVAVDRSWIGLLPLQGRRYMAFVEDGIFGCQHDDLFRSPAKCLLVDWLVGCLFNRREEGRLVVCLVGWLVDCLVGSLVVGLVVWLFGFLVVWLFGRLVVWLFGCLVV